MTSTALWICLFVDANSIFQVCFVDTLQALFNFFWFPIDHALWCNVGTQQVFRGFESLIPVNYLNRFERPAWTVGVLIPCSFLCGIIAAVLIWWGGQKTKRVAEVEERLRAALAAEGNQTSNNPPTQPKEPVQPSEKELQVDECMTVPASSNR